MEGTVSPFEVEAGETVPTHRSIEQKRIDQEGLKKEQMALGPSRSKGNDMKKTIIEITILVLLILGVALAARMVGKQASLLPWSW